MKTTLRTKREISINSYRYTLGDPGALSRAGGTKSDKEMKRRISALLVNMRRFISLPDLFPPAPTNCPWVSEDSVSIYQVQTQTTEYTVPPRTEYWVPVWPAVTKFPALFIFIKILATKEHQEKVNVKFSHMFSSYSLESLQHRLSVKLCLRNFLWQRCQTFSKASL